MSRAVRDGRGEAEAEPVQASSRSAVRAGKEAG